MKDENQSKKGIISEWEEKKFEYESTEKLLRESEEWLKILFEFAPDGYYLNDLEGNFIDGNKAAEEIVGYDREELIGKSFLKLKLLDPKQIPIAASLLAKNLLGQSTGPDEFTLTRRDGSHIPVEIKTYPVKIKGKTVVLGIARDTTERRRAEEELNKHYDNLEKLVEERTKNLEETNKRLENEITCNEQTEKVLRVSEERFRSLVETSADLIFRLTITGRIEYISPRVKELYGYDVDELIGKNLRVTTPLQDIPEVLKALNMVIAGNSLKNFKINQKDKAGRIFPMEINAVPIYVGTNIVGLQGVMRDITERKKAEEQIQKDLKEKEVLLKEIHHRVKNNLQVISSLLHLQARQIKDKQALKMFEESRNRVRSMVFVYERLYHSRDFSKVDFADYVKNLSSSLFRAYSMAPDKIKLMTKIGDVSLGIDLAIPCGLIINELVSNTLKHAFPPSFKGKAKIEIALHPTESGELELIVKDNGVGIPKELDIRKTESLGMQLVFILAEDQLEGEVKLDRREGTKFTIRFKQEQL